MGTATAEQFVDEDRLPRAENGAGELRAAATGFAKDPYFSGSNVISKRWRPILPAPCDTMTTITVDAIQTRSGALSGKPSPAALGADARTAIRRPEICRLRLAPASGISA